MDTLSQEILIHVLSFLPKACDLLHCREVSLEWKQLSEDETMWKSVYLQRWKIPKGDVTIDVLEEHVESFNWQQEYKNNETLIPRKKIQKLTDHTDQVWIAKWSMDGKYLATASKDSRCIIYELKEEKNNKPHLDMQFEVHLSESIAFVDWSFSSKYVVATTLASKAYIVSISLKEVVMSYHCTQFDTYARWLPDESLLVGSNVLSYENYFMQHTLWRKYPVTEEKHSYKTLTFTNNCVHVPTYIPHSNSLAFLTGVHPSITNILNLIFITRLPGTNLVKPEDDPIWKDRSTIKEIVLAETGAILGARASPSGRWLLLNVRPFVNPPPCYIPKRPLHIINFPNNNITNKNNTNNINDDNYDYDNDNDDDINNDNNNNNNNNNYNDDTGENDNDNNNDNNNDNDDNNEDNEFNNEGNGVDYEEVDVNPLLAPPMPVYRREVHSESMLLMDLFEGEQDPDADPTLANNFELHLWDLYELKLVKVYVGHTAESPSDSPFLCWPDIAKTSDTPYFATGSENFSIYVYHRAHRYPIHILSEHADLVNSVDFHPKGHLLVSASDDNSVNLWATTEN